MPSSDKRQVPVFVRVVRLSNFGSVLGDSLIVSRHYSASPNDEMRVFLALPNNLWWHPCQRSEMKFSNVPPGFHSMQPLVHRIK